MKNRVAASISHNSVALDSFFLQNLNNSSVFIVAFTSLFYCRPRRRSGSSIVVLDGELEHVKKHPDDLDDPPDYNMVMMLPGDNGPHREMAVDVPDTFIARNKTPPRYPPPKPLLQVNIDNFTSSDLLDFSYFTK